MQKIIVDTNVLVSALIQRSYPNLILHEILSGDRIIFCISEELLQEYYVVLRRIKFVKYPDFVLNAEKLLVLIEQRTRFFNPTHAIKLLKDPRDNKLLELAEISKANYLITGNTNDFKLKKYKKTNIVTPREYWELFHENQ